MDHCAPKMGLNSALRGGEKKLKIGKEREGDAFTAFRHPRGLSSSSPSLFFFPFRLFAFGKRLLARVSLSGPGIEKDVSEDDFDAKTRYLSY